MPRLKGRLGRVPRRLHRALEIGAWHPLQQYGALADTAVVYCTKQSPREFVES